MKNVNGFQTPFGNAVMPTQGVAGNNVAVTNGVELNGGQKGTSSVIPQVITVSVNGVTSSPSATGIIANR